MDLLEAAAPTNNVILQPLALSDFHIAYGYVSLGVSLDCVLFRGHPQFTQFTLQCGHRREGALPSPQTCPVTGPCELHH